MEEPWQVISARVLHGFLPLFMVNYDRVWESSILSSEWRHFIGKNSRISDVGGTEKRWASFEVAYHSTAVVTYVGVCYVF